MSIFDPSKYTTETGTDAAEKLVGTDDNDLIDGVGGDDTLVGGKGSDAYIVSKSTVAIVEKSGEGVDSVESSVSYTLSNNLENLYLSEKQDETKAVVNINGFGNASSNSISGNTGNNTLDGRGGTDTLVGGRGDDTYIINETGVSIYEKNKEGTDTVQSSISYGIGLYFENLVLTGNTNINGVGNILNNVITGNNGQNLLYSGLGNDTVYGGVGDDTIYAGDGNDSVDGGANDDIVYGEAGNDTLSGGLGVNYVSGGKGNDVLYGNGSDTLDGGIGNDSYVVGTVDDTIIDSAGIDTVISYDSYLSLGYSLENLVLQGVLNFNGNGNYLANAIYGNIGNNILDGKEGNDLISGGDGDDLLIGGAGNDNLYGGTGNDTLAGGDGINYKEQNKLYGGLGDDIYKIKDFRDLAYEGKNEGIDLVQSYVNSYALAANVENMELKLNAVNGYGNNLSNTITGNVSDNYIDGGTGVDTLIGGIGNDSYVVDNVNDVVTEEIASGTDIVYSSSANYSLSANVENISLIGKYNINGAGNDLANTVVGNIGANILDGGINNDTIYGGKGDDTIIGGIGDDILYGEIGNDTYKISSADGNDTITDSSGTSTLEFTDLKFSDVTKITHNTTNPKRPIITIEFGSQVIEVRDSFSTQLKFIDGIIVPIQNYQRFINGYNSSSIMNDVIFYNVSILDGKAGNDILIGGNSTGVVIGAEGDDLVVATKSGSEVYGDIKNTTISGNDTIYGNESSNLTGGYGNDTYVLYDDGDIIVEDNVTVTDKKGKITNLSGIDTIISYKDYTFLLVANVENLTLVDVAVTGIGNELNNVITGNDFGNVLDGISGKDTLVGGGGNDTYYLYDNNAVASEAKIVGYKNRKAVYGDAGGTDNVITNSSHVLGAYIENLTITGNSDANATGNNLNNIIVGNTGKNIINGGIGADTMIGGAGDDTYIVDNSADVITEATTAGIDSVVVYANYSLSDNIENITLAGKSNLAMTANGSDNLIIGNIGNNAVDGASGKDTIYAGAGNDIVTGGADDDILEGGAGNDIYYVKNNDGVDVITDRSGTSTIVFTDLKFSDMQVVNYDYTNRKYPILTIKVSGTQTLTINGSLSTVLRFAEGVSVPIQSYNVFNYVNNYGTKYNDFINYNGATIDGGSGNDLIRGGALTSIIYGGVGNDILVATSNNEILEGGIGNDILYGIGNSILNGGSGNDTYVVGSASDIAYDLAGIDTVLSSVDYSLGQGIENLTLFGTSNAGGAGNSLNNVITGNIANNTLLGGDGNDVINGADGNDFVGGENGNDTLYGGSGDDTLEGGDGTVSTEINKLYGGIGNDTYLIHSLNDQIFENVPDGTDTVVASISYVLGKNLENLVLSGVDNIDATGNIGNNTVTGNVGSNNLKGGGGNDTLVGGFGDDNYIVDGTTDVIVENDGEGNDKVTSTVNYSLNSNIENLTLTGKTAIIGIGNAIDNLITGSEFGNTLSGGDGNDTIFGLAGTDTLYGENGNDSLDGGDGNDRLYGGDGNDYQIGGNGDDLVFGEAGDDTLEDSDGYDSLLGGLGNDTYVVNSSKTLINENNEVGIDVVKAGISYTLGNYVEHLILTGSSNLDGIGNDLNNSITGNSGSNILDGKAGTDTLVGGAGDDVYIIDEITDVVIEEADKGKDTVQAIFSYNLVDLNLTNIENITLLGVADLTATGNDSNNYLSGNDGNNTLTSALGDDTLDGGLGIDSMVGGDGNDTYYIDTITDTIVENIHLDKDYKDIGGIDTVNVSFNDYTLIDNFENLTLIGNSLKGTGNNLDNKIIGNDYQNVLDAGIGDDTLDGGLGADYMLGGTGDDTYYIDSASDTVNEKIYEGDDTVNVKYNGYSLSQYVENLILLDKALTATGNSANNYIQGSESDNYLYGGAGNDIISGLEGNDTLEGQSGVDMLIGGEGDDVYVIRSTDEFDFIVDSNGTDVIYAYADAVMVKGIENAVIKSTTGVTVIGNDVLNSILGGSGNDYIYGGGGGKVEEAAYETLDGGAGGDTMVGGVGRTLFKVDDKNDKIIDLDYSDDWGNYRDRGIPELDFDTIEVALKDYGYASTSNFRGMSSTFSIGDNVTAFVKITSTGKVNIVGGNQGNTIIGNENINIIQGGSGDDYISGHGVSATNSKTLGDTLLGGYGDDDIIVLSDNDVAIEYMGQGIDKIHTNKNCDLTGNNTGKAYRYFEQIHLMSAGLIGWGTSKGESYSDSNGDNLLSGVGNCTLYGRSGDDTYKLYRDSVDVLTGEKTEIKALDVFVENKNEGTDTVISQVSYTLAANIENLIGSSPSTNPYSLALTGNDLNNTVSGDSGNDTLDGSTGADTMYGFDGNDTYYIDNIGDIIAEGSGEKSGTDTVNSSITYTIGQNFENLMLTGTANLNGYGNDSDNAITGNDGNNILDGGDGKDTIIGGLGKDTMIGGAGDDTYIVENTGDKITEIDGEGTKDQVDSTALNYTLSGNIEIFNLNGKEDINGTGDFSNNSITGNSGKNIIYGMDGNDTILGLDGNDTIFGGNGNDTLDGGLGVDNIDGGEGDDTICIDEVLEVSKVRGGGGIDTVETMVSFTLNNSSDIENITLKGSEKINATGNDLNNKITGNSSANIIDSGFGSDTINGGGGGDTIIFREGYTLIIEGAGDADTLLSYATDYTNSGSGVKNIALASTGVSIHDGDSATNMIGNAQANTISGGKGDDTITGGGGADDLIGGEGNDVYIINTVDFALATITEAYQAKPVKKEDLKLNEDTAWAYVNNYTLADNVDNLIIKGISNFSGYGNTIDNSITGNTGKNYLFGADGDDTLDGGGGFDTLEGGTGNDTYIVDNLGLEIVETSGNGIDEIKTKFNSFDLSDVMYSAIENLTLAGENVGNGSGNNNDNKITGNAKANILFGLLGNDTLDGGGGKDTLVGGLGDDTYLIADLNTDIDEKMGEGTDTIQTKISYTISDIFENITLDGDADINGTGNYLNNVLTGNKGKNTLDGAGGVDTLIGGEGDDTYIVMDPTSVVTEKTAEGNDTLKINGDFTTTGSNIENITLLGTGNFNITNDAVDMTLIGNVGNNTITGSTGKDTIDGGGSSVADSLVGGAGDDTYVVHNSADIITELSGAGIDSVKSSATYSLGLELEHLTLTGTSSINGFGNDFDNTLIGNSGNNTIDGGIGKDTIDDGGTLDTLLGGGVDTLIGGVGDDTYIVSNSSVIINEIAAEGTDLVQSSASYVLATNLENLELIGSKNINGTGNAEDNTITGNGANNTLDGGGGTDLLVGGSGDDTYIMSTDVTISESAGGGTDTVVVSSTDFTLADNLENIILTNATPVSVTANDMDNVISGFIAGDTIIGGLGSDTYMIDNLDVFTIIEDTIPADTPDEDKKKYTNDTAIASLSGYTLADNVENLILSGTLNLSGSGNSSDNFLTGNIGNNILYGGDGNDSITGGLGVDTLYGDAGDDTLDGGKQGDSLIGGLGDDTYIIGNKDVIVEAVGGGLDTVVVSYSCNLNDPIYTNIEGVTLTGDKNLFATGTNADNKLTGNDGMNILDGGAGDDTLEGGKGYDILIGGDGNDTYIFKEADLTEVLDQIYDTGGNDTCEADLSVSLGDALYSSLENITLIGDKAINANGNSANNKLTGNKSANTINAGAGNDILDGGKGNDFLLGGAGNDTYLLNVGDGNDEIQDSSGNDTILFGADFDNTKFAIFQEATGDLSIKYSDNDVFVIKQYRVFQVEKIQMQDGHYLTDINISQIINNINTFNSSQSDPNLRITSIDSSYTANATYSAQIFAGVTWS